MSDPIPFARLLNGSHFMHKGREWVKDSNRFAYRAGSEPPFHVWPLDLSTMVQPCPGALVKSISTPARD